MLIRALLFSIVIHAFVLLGSTEGSVWLRIVPVRAPGLRATLVSRGAAPEKLVVQASSGRTTRPPSDRRASDTSPPKLPARQVSVWSGADPDDLGHDLHSILDEMAPSADVLRQYRLDLARAARQFRRFPGLAHDQTKEGDVLILVSFDLVSDKPVIELASSSAYPELDAEAVALFGIAVRSVSVPASLRGRPFSLSLMLRYSRRDE